MIRLRAVFMVEEEGVPARVAQLLKWGAVAIEIDYSPEEP